MLECPTLCGDFNEEGFAYGFTEDFQNKGEGENK